MDVSFLNNLTPLRPTSLLKNVKKIKIEKEGEEFDVTTLDERDKKISTACAFSSIAPLNKNTYLTQTQGLIEKQYCQKGNKVLDQLEIVQKGLVGGQSKEELLELLEEPFFNSFEVSDKNLCALLKQIDIRRRVTLAQMSK